MARQYEGRVTFIGVAGHDNIGPMQEFVDRHDLKHFPHAATENGDLWAKWGISYQPAYVFIAPDGEIVYKATRPPDEDLLAALDDLAARA